MSKIENAVKWMEQAAADNSHGYDQIYRWGEKGDYDCSAAVITALEKSGIPAKTKGATYTGNIRKVLLSLGFKDVKKQVNTYNSVGMRRGDILLAEGHHVAMYCGGGKEVEAAINEKGTAKGGKPGDQTGREFLVRAYRNYPWTHVLRYTEAETKVQNEPKKETNKETTKKKSKSLMIKAKSGLNLRKDAGVSSLKICSIPYGKTVEWVNQESKSVSGVVWCKIKYGNHTGYAHSKWLG